MAAQRNLPPRLSPFTLRYLALLGDAFRKQDIIELRRILRILTPTSQHDLGYRDDIDKLVTWGTATRVDFAASVTTSEEVAFATAFVTYMSAVAWDVSLRTCERAQLYDPNVRDEVSQTVIAHLLQLLRTPLLVYVRTARSMRLFIRQIARDAVTRSRGSRMESYWGQEDRIRGRA